MRSSKEKNPANGKTAHNPEKLKIYGLFAVTALIASFIILKDGGLQQYLGGVLVTSILMGILYRDILRYKPKYLEKYSMLILLALMIVGTLGLARGTEYTLRGLAVGLELNAGDAILYGIPIAAGAMLVTLLFDFHTAIMFSFVASLLAGIWQSDAGFALYSFVGSLTASFSMIHCKKRTAILIGGAYVLGANVLSVITLLLLNGTLFAANTHLAITFAVASAVMIIAIVSLLLPILEYLFKVTTDISLLELLDLDHPIMKSLMISAPGTYHHSIILGNLVESCAEVVGVNPLLARVGAYYHDIGKSKMPEYFIENQTTGVNKHEHLNPHMSSMILISHVKEGVDLAAQHNIPAEVCDIIMQHHGTALIKYFYEKAKGQAGGIDLSTDEYKYPGPRPQTRVAALIMMADAVEAASRVLHDPTPSRIGSLVDRIINHIFLDGQLDECELTLKDIYAIKLRFTYILTGILHKRIDYPGFDFNKDEKYSESHNLQQAAEARAAHSKD